MKNYCGKNCILRFSASFIKLGGAGYYMRRTLSYAALTAVMTMYAAVSAAAYTFRSFDNLGGRMSHLCVRGITQTGDGMMWLATESGLYSYDGYHLTGYGYATDRKGAQSAGMLTCTSVTAAGDSLVIGSDSGVLSFNIRTGKFCVLPYAEGETVCGMERLGGRLWVATDKGLYCDGRLSPVRVDGAVGMGGSGEYVYIGGVDGVSRYSTVRHSIERVADGLEYAACLLVGDRQLWVGSATAVTLIDTDSGAKMLSMPVPVAKCLLRTDDGRLLVGTDDGLYIVSQDGKRMERIAHDARYGNSLAGNAVWSIYEDRDGNIWIGTDGGVSLVKRDGLMTVYPLPLVTGNGDGNRFTTVLSDSRGRFWLGGAGGLLCVEHLDTDRQTSRWYRMNDRKYPIGHNHVRCVMETKAGRIAVGGDMGVMIYDEDTRQFVPMRLDADDTGWVYGMEEMRDGSILLTTFMATYNAVFDYAHNLVTVKSRHKRRDLTAKAGAVGVYLGRDGQERRFLSAYNDAERGITLLGGNDCFALMKNSEYKRKVRAVAFTGVMVNGEERLPFDKDNGVCVTLPADMTFVEVMFSDFDYSKQIPDEYQYRLDSGEWLPVMAAGCTVMLAGLSAGRHVLAVRNTRNDGAQAELSLSVKPHWYASTVAKTLYLLLGCLPAYMICLFVRQRRRLERERAERQMLAEKADETERRIMSENMYLATRLRVQQRQENGNEAEFTADERFLADITDMIKANMADAGFNVDTLCRLSGTGGKQLYRKIKTLTGMTTVAYIRSLRMQRAAALLAKGSLTVSEVMYAVGFSSPSYFTKCFQEEYGVTPSEYVP